MRLNDMQLPPFEKGGRRGDLPCAQGREIPLYPPFSKGEIRGLSIYSSWRRPARAFKDFFRRRMFLGVTSTSSSEAMNSIACSSESTRCGVSMIASSEPEARILESCFFLQGFI